MELMKSLKMPMEFMIEPELGMVAEPQANMEILIAEMY
jgi:hypothetical protein